MLCNVIICFLLIKLSILKLVGSSNYILTSLIDSSIADTVRRYANEKFFFEISYFDFYCVGILITFEYWDVSKSTTVFLSSKLFYYLKSLMCTEVRILCSWKMKVHKNNYQRLLITAFLMCKELPLFLTCNMLPLVPLCWCNKWVIGCIW